MEAVINMLAGDLKDLVSEYTDKHGLSEIRLRVGSPLYVKSIGMGAFLSESRIISRRDIDDTLSNITLNSIHTFEREIQSGYITMEGGHRVGLGGDCIYEGDSFRGFKSITSLNIRIARAFAGCSDKYIEYFTDSQGPLNVLIAGPPLSGKTTLIRDIASKLSDGGRNFSGCDVTLIDERGEISAVYRGVPQLYVGRRTDILSYCRKREGFNMSIRALAPAVIVSDELGAGDDFEIIQYALKSGVSIVSTAHGSDLSDLEHNIYLKPIIDKNFFDRVVVLKGGGQPTAVSTIYDMKDGSVIYDDGD